MVQYTGPEAMHDPLLGSCGLTACWYLLDLKLLFNMVVMGSLTVTLLMAMRPYGHLAILVPSTVPFIADRPGDRVAPVDRVLPLYQHGGCVVLLNLALTHI